MLTSGHYLSSIIRTIPSVTESHRIMPDWLADYTAGGELRPASKISIHIFVLSGLYRPSMGICGLFLRYLL